MGQSVCPQCGSGADVRSVAELFAMLNGAQGGAMQQGYPPQQMGPDYPGTYPDYPAQGYQGPDSAGTNPGYPAQGYQGPDSAGAQGPDSAGTNPNPDSAGSSPDHPYESYQGPGIPTAQGYQGQGPAPGYQGPPPGYQGPPPGYQGPGYQGPSPDYQGPDYPNNRRGRPTINSDFVDDPVQEIANTVLGAAFKFAGRSIGKRMQRAYEEKIGPALEARAAQARQQWQQSRDEQAAIVQRYPDLRGCLRDQVVFLDGGSRSVPISEIRMPPTLAQADALVNRLRGG
jgi:hypothetical protein